MEGGLGGGGGWRGGTEGNQGATKEADQTGKKCKMARREELVFLPGGADRS